jgi:ribosomal protein S6
MEKSDMNQDKRLKVYEVGYLLVPTIPEEHLASEVETIKSVIEKYEGAFITEDFPKLRQLAYTMRKASSGQNLKFDKAYFGWIKFEISPAAIPVLQKDLEKNGNFLRIMIIATVRENTLYTQKNIFRPTLPTDATDPTHTTEEKPKMTEEEIDKTIEKLVVE